MFPHVPKDSNNQIYQEIPNLSLTREHASRQCTASRTSCHQHKHATSRSITQHWNAITPVERLYILLHKKNRHASGRTTNINPCMTRICSHMNPKMPTNTYFNTFSSSPSLENMHAKVSHQDRLANSASMPREKASQNVEKRSHRLYRLTNPQQPARRNSSTFRFVLVRTQIFQQSNLPRHSKTYPSKYRINNVSSSAQARQEHKDHAPLARSIDFTNPQEQARLRADDYQKPLHDPDLFAHEPKDSIKHILYNIVKLAKVSHQKRLGTNARTPSAKVSRSIKTQQHRLNGLNPQQRARLHADHQQKTLHDPDLFSNKPKHSNN